MPLDRRISELTDKMLGGSSDTDPHPGKIMKVKAAEISVLMPFGVYAVERLHPGFVAHQHELAAAGKALCSYLEIIRKAGPVVTEVEHQDLMDCMVRHHVLSEIAQIHSTPKDHLCIHLTVRTGGASVQPW